jgi:hypothetical protein
MGRHSPDNRNIDDSSTRVSARRRLTRKVASHALHPITHIVALLSAHIVALGILEKTPLLTMLFLH